MADIDEKYGHWKFDKEFDPAEWFGFIYRITELDTGRMYIGKKNFTKLRRKVVKGRKNRKHERKTSDWMTYTGSSSYLNEEIEKKGKDNYLFEIESLHKTKGSLHYAEIQKQVNEDVLRAKMDDGVTRKYFNRAINSVRFLPPEEQSAETCMKRSESLLALYADKSNFWYNKLSDQEKEEYKQKYFYGENRPSRRNKTEAEYQQWLDTNMRGENNPMFGKEPPQKDKTYEELYGAKRAEEIKDKIRLNHTSKGERHGMYGKTHSEESRRKISAGNKGKNTGEDNPMYGKPCFYKMTEEEKEQWKTNVANAIRGKKRSEEFCLRQSEARKGLKKPLVTCPHCQKTGGNSNMTRYHFENCKEKK